MIREASKAVKREALECARELRDLGDVINGVVQFAVALAIPVVLFFAGWGVIRLIRAAWETPLSFPWK